MSIRVHVQTIADDTIIALDGAVDADLLAHLGDGIAAVAAVADGRSGIIARRVATRQVLAHWGVPGRIAIYDRHPEGDT